MKKDPFLGRRAYKWMLEEKGYDWKPGFQMERFDHGIRELARELGVSHTTVRNKLDLLSQPKYVMDDIF